MKLNLFLAGATLLASQAWAGSVSNVPGTLDATLVDPSPALFPHFICASGCGGGSGGGAVTQSGAWNVGIMNFPAVQAVGGSVSISNLPTTQQVSGSISVANFPGLQTMSGSAATPLTQGIGASGASSLNVYVGGGVGVSAPSSLTQPTVYFFEQTTPAGVPIDPTMPMVATSINASTSIAAANNFQTMLPSSVTRRGCTFQNTSSDIEYIDVGDASGTATKARSYQIQPGNYWSCSQSSGLVISDILSITGPNGGDTFVLTIQ